jgi:hypothetical protein
MDFAVARVDKRVAGGDANGDIQVATLGLRNDNEDIFVAARVRQRLGLRIDARRTTGPPTR